MIAALLLWVLAAWAEPVTLCLDYQVDFLDSDILVNPLTGVPDASLVGDYLSTNDNVPARGARIHATRLLGGVPIVVYTAYAADSGANAGCADFDLEAGATFRFSVLSQLQIRDHVVTILGSSDPSLVIEEPDDPWAELKEVNVTGEVVIPSGGGTLHRATPGTNKYWNVSAALGHALERRDAGLSGEHFYVFLQDCPTINGSPASCADAGNIHLGENGQRLRFVAVHEFGHAIHHRLNEEMEAGAIDEGSGGDPSYSDIDSCDSGTSHRLTSKEYHSGAITESFAHFYASVAFNVTWQADCGFVYYKFSEDWDGDGVWDTGCVVSDPNCNSLGLNVGMLAISCATGPSANPTIAAEIVPNPPTTDHLAWECDTPSAGTAMPLDWLRHWRNFLKTSTYDFTGVARVLRGACSRCPSNGWDSASLDPTDANSPYSRLRGAVNAQNLSTWDTSAATHGVDYGY